MTAAVRCLPFRPFRPRDRPMTRRILILRPPRPAATIWLLVLMQWWIVGCGGRGGPPRPNPPVGARPSPPLRIAAASDLQAVLPKLADRFRARRGFGITP